MNHHLGDTYYVDHPEESIIQPIGDLAKIIQKLSEGDLLLFFLAQSKQAQMKKRFDNDIVIGFND